MGRKRKKKPLLLFYLLLWIDLKTEKFKETWKKERKERRELVALSGGGAKVAPRGFQKKKKKENLKKNKRENKIKIKKKKKKFKKKKKENEINKTEHPKWRKNRRKNLGKLEEEEKGFLLEKNKKKIFDAFLVLSMSKNEEAHERESIESERTEGFWWWVLWRQLRSPWTKCVAFPSEIRDGSASSAAPWATSSQ